MKISRNIILASIFLMALVTRVFAATEVTSITASPGTFNPITNQTTTITVQATPGVTGMEVRVLLPDQITVVRSGLALTETTPGAYTTTWDGKNDSHSGVVAGSYVIRVFNPGTTTFIGPWSDVTVAGLSVTPTTFTPTGTNAATITVQATPGQTGMYLRFYSPSFGSWYESFNSWYGNKTNLPLNETTTPGVYSAQWDAMNAPNQQSQNFIVGNGTYTITVYDSAGNQSATTGQIIIKGLSSVDASPQQLNAAGGQTTTITATGETGLNLWMKVLKQNQNTGVWETQKTSMMTGTGTTYTTTWDGKNESGALVPVGTYTIWVGHTGASARYYPTTTVQVSAVVTSVTSSPSTFTPTGTNAATITVQATPGQTGMYLRFNSPNLVYWYGNGTDNLPLKETTTPGVYSAQWDAIYYPYQQLQNFIGNNETYTITVYYSAGNQSATKGQIIIKGLSSVDASPQQFNAAGGQTTTITATGETGLNLWMKVLKQNQDTGV